MRHVYFLVTFYKKAHSRMDASKITELRQKQNTVYLHRSNTVDSSTMTWRNQIQSSKYIKGMPTCADLQNTDVPTESVCNQSILATGPTGYTEPMGDTGATGDNGSSGTNNPVLNCLPPYPRRGAAGSASTVYSSDKILLRNAGRAYCAELITDQDMYTILPNCVTVNTNGPTSDNPNPPVNNQDTNPYLPPFDTYYRFKNRPAPVIDQNQKHYVQYCNGCATEPIVTRYGWPLWMVGAPNSIIISNSVAYYGERVYVTGTFTGTIYAYDGTPTPPPVAGVPNVIMTSASTNLDTFLMVYDRSGKIMWFTTMKAIGGTQATGYSVVVDSSGIYLSGYTDGTVNFYHAIARDTYELYGPIISSVSTATSALYVLKYTLSGYLQWVTLVDNIETQPTPNTNGPEIQPTLMSQLCTDGRNVYVCNYFNTSATVYNSNGVQPLTMDNSIPLASMSNSTQGFLVQYDAVTGATNWATRLLGDDNTLNGTTRPAGLVCDANNVYMSGFFNNTATCYDAVTPGSPLFGAYRYKISNGNNNGMFIMSYNKSGIVQWINQGNISASPFVPSGVQLTMDATGVYVVVPFPGAISFNNNPQPPGGGSFIQLINTGGANTYNIGIVKYTLAGSLVWVNKILNVDNGSGTLYTNGFSLSSDGSALYVTGGFGQNTIGLYNSSTTGDPTPQVATLSTAGGTNTNVFLIKYNLLGALQWSTIIGRPGGYAYGYSVTANTNLIYVTGTANGPVDLYHSNGLAQPNKIATSLVTSAYLYTYVVKYDHNGQVVLA
jgi:hypothetical protein